MYSLDPCFSSAALSKRKSTAHSVGPFHPLGFLRKTKSKEKGKAVWQKAISLREEQSEIELLVQRERITAWFLTLLLLV